jgi:hypothetical protein
LLIEVIFVPYYFQSSKSFAFVIVDFYDLSEGTPPDSLQKFIPISNMIVNDVFVFIIFVVEGSLIRPVVSRIKYEFMRFVPNKVNMFKLQNFLPFVFSEILFIFYDGFYRSEGQLHLSPVELCLEIYIDNLQLSVDSFMDDAEGFITKLFSYGLVPPGHFMFFVHTVIVMFQSLGTPLLRYL